MSRQSKYADSISIKENKWIAAIYIRLSVEDGDKVESNSVRNQRDLLNNFLNENRDIFFYDYYIDDGYSGTDFNRPGIKRLLKDMKENKFNTVIVKDLSRLGRNYIEVGNYIEQVFPLFNIRFIAVNDTIDSFKNPDSVNNVIVPFKNLLNDEYCRDISNKIRSVLNVKKRNGEYVSSFVPYGYIKDPKDIHHLIVDPEPAKVVRMIYEWSLEGMGRGKIAEKLNQLGILNPLGYKNEVLNKNYTMKKITNKTISYAWDMTVLQKMLCDETYCGDTVQNRGRKISYKIHKYVRNKKDDWIIVRNTHEPIIERDMFEKVQKAINSRDTRVGKNGYLTYFAGHIKCADCERAMVKKVLAEYKGKPRPYYYYVCSTYVRRSKALCTKHTIRNDILEDVVLKALQVQIALVINTEQTIQKISKKETVNFKKKLIEDNLIKMQKEVEKQIALKKSAYEDWKLGYLTEEEYNEYTKDYSKRIEQIEKNICNAKEELQNYQNNGNANKWIEEFKKYKNVSSLSKNLVDDLVDDIFVHQDGNITIKFLYEDELKKAMEYISNSEKIIYLNEENTTAV